MLARLNAVNRDLGLPEMAEYDPARRGAADSCFVAADVDTLAGLGAAGGGAHAEGEWVDLASLPRQAKRAAILITRLTRERADRPRRKPDPVVEATAWIRPSPDDDRGASPSADN